MSHVTSDAAMSDAPSFGETAPRPRYVPYRNGKARLAMGLMALGLADWIDPDAAYAAELREKQRLLAADHGAVFAALPESFEWWLFKNEVKPKA